MSNTQQPHYIARAPVLGATDTRQLTRLLNEVAVVYRDVQSLDLLEAAPLIAQDFPRSLREFFHEARVGENGAVLVVPALGVIGETRTPTPRDWKDVVSPTPTHLAEIFLVLAVSLLGDVFGWTTQQNGRYVHDVLPIRGLEYEQVGWSSL